MVKLKKNHTAKKLSKKNPSKKKLKKIVKVKIGDLSNNATTVKGSIGVSKRKRKLSLSESSLGSSGPKDQKLKRVSFAEKLEDTKVFVNSVKKLKVEPSSASPGKSILAKKSELKRSCAQNCVKEVKVETAESGEKESTQIIKPKKKTIIQVPRKVKEKLLSLPRKERKAYLRELHKKKKPFFDLAVQCKKLWEIIRSSRSKKADKEKSVDALFGLVRGKVKELIFAHDTCRVIQCLVTFPRPDIRSAIFDELTPEIIKMSKSSYAHFFVSKMLARGTPAQRNIIIEAFRGHCVSLMKVQFAASRVLERAFNDYANPKQRWNIVSEFYGNEFILFRDSESTMSLDEILAREPSKKQHVVAHLESLLKDIVTKSQLRLSLTHRLLYDFFKHCNKEQKAEMIDSLKDRIPEIIHTMDGSYVALECVWHGNTKERKSIVKSFKGCAVKAAQDQYGHRVLMGIFDSVDDTVLVSKCIIQEIGNNIRDVAFDLNGIRVLHYLINPRNFRYFYNRFLQILQKGDGNEYSKKNPKDRYTQLFSSLSQPLFNFIAGSLEDLIFNPKTALLVLYSLETSGGTNLCQRVVSDDARKACYDAIVEICKREFIPCDTENLHPIEHPQAHYVISHLIESDAGSNVKLSDCLATLGDSALASWIACNRGCYVLLRMLEHGSFETKKLLVSCIPQKSLRSYSSKGAVSLLEKLSSWKE